jgi:hypothetical protein
LPTSCRSFDVVYSPETVSFEKPILGKFLEWQCAGIQISLHQVSDILEFAEMKNYSVDMG